MEHHWWCVPYTRGVVWQDTPGEQWFPHFSLECPDGPLDAYIGDSPPGSLRSGGRWLVPARRASQGAQAPVGEPAVAAEGGEVHLKQDDGSFIKLDISVKPNTCLVVRLGAYGDMMQCSSIFPGLKRQGYHIVLHCSPRGYPVVQHDPNIDEFVLQDPDQVPPNLLTAYFQWLASRVAKFINLSESVEGTLLAMPGRPVSFWPKAARHMVCNSNYVELTHALAGLPYKHPETKFHATQAELEDTRTFLSTHGGRPNVLWALSGSAVHKVYPYIDSIVARILLAWPTARIFMVGDELSQLLEEPWRNEPRVVRMSGQLEIRPTLCLASACDLVIGPETGIMSAVSTMDMGKVVLLSHSTVDNLTRDWTNTQSVYSKRTECYPCHMMIYGWDQCRQGPKTGTAQCQEDIDPDQVWQAVQRAMRRYHMQRAA